MERESEVNDILEKTDAVLRGLPARPQAPYFPPSSDRDRWNAIGRADAEATIACAERFLGTHWPVLPAARYADFHRNGDRSRYQELYFGRRTRVLANLLAEATENRGRFVEQIITGCWAICEETSWTVPAHNHLYRDGRERELPDPREPIVALFSAETGSLLAAVLTVVGPQLDDFSPMVAERIRHEILHRLITPFLERDDFWWIGLTEKEVNNWTPWIVASLLSALLGLEPSLDMMRAVMRKGTDCISRFLDVYADDGGCDEGASYWSHAAGSLFDAADLLRHLTAGGLDLLSLPKVREMGRYLSRVHIDSGWFVNYADGPAWNEQASPQLVFRFGEAIGDERLEALGVDLFRTLTPGPFDPMRYRYAGRGIWSLLYSRALRESRARYSPVSEAWMPGIQVVTARAGDRRGNRRGLFFSAKGGDNHESHNHNDVGSFVLFLDGRPVIIDPGVEEYTSKTFSEDRYTIWTMRSAYHNLPVINGSEQRPDSAGDPHPAADVGVELSKDAVRFSLDLAPAYPPCGVHSWQRTYTLERGSHPALTVVEAIRASRLPSAAELVFMTWREPRVTADGFTVAAGNAVPAGGRASADAPGQPDEAQVSLVMGPCRNARVGKPIVERIAIDDQRLEKVWGSGIYRVVVPVHDIGEKAEIGYTIAERSA